MSLRAWTRPFVVVAVAALSSPLATSVAQAGPLPAAPGGSRPAAEEGPIARLAALLADLRAALGSPGAGDRRRPPAAAATTLSPSTGAADPRGRAGGGFSAASGTQDPWGQPAPVPGPGPGSGG
jgi:hypothetical protein